MVLLYSIRAAITTIAVRYIERPVKKRTWNHYKNGAGECLKKNVMVVYKKQEMLKTIQKLQ